MMLKMDVLTAMPRARVAMAIAANQGDLAEDAKQTSY